ncbi:MAG: hypothetical protein J3K34DRAFT_467071 [Monoraphidium minutum]|nr:MAG: hypothetical protein J3K34DRAFT_467071 [Monoraphidium minutum]
MTSCPPITEALEACSLQELARRLRGDPSAGVTLALTCRAAHAADRACVDALTLHVPGDTPCGAPQEGDYPDRRCHGSAAEAALVAFFADGRAAGQSALAAQLISAAARMPHLRALAICRPSWAGAPPCTLALANAIRPPPLAPGALAALTALTALRVEGLGVGAAGVPALTHLRTLELFKANLGIEARLSDGGAAGLAPLARLATLRVENCGLRADCAAAIGGWGSALTLLDISQNNIGSHARVFTSVNAMAALAALPRLRALRAACCGLAPDEVAALAAGLTALTLRDLSRNYIGAGGLRALSSLTALRHLTVSGVHRTCVAAIEGGATATAAAAAALTGLTALRLGHNYLRDAGALALAAAAPPGLWVLDLTSSVITIGGAAAVVGIKSLRELRLADNPGICVRSANESAALAALVAARARLPPLDLLDLTACGLVGSRPAAADAGDAAAAAAVSLKGVARTLLLAGPAPA